MHSKSAGNLDRLAIHPIKESQVEDAEKLVRSAFGAFLNLPEPDANPTDRRMIAHRFRQNPETILVAVLDDELVGTNVMTRWGTFAFFGPLAVRPDLWNSGIGTSLVAAAVADFNRARIYNLGLFTFADSPKHLGLYHKFGFRSRFLTTLMGKETVPDSGSRSVRFERYSEISCDQKQKTLGGIKQLTNELHPGLNLSEEIMMVEDQKLGDTILVFDGANRVGGFAVCQSGAKTEAGVGNCYVKFAASRVGANSGILFDNLLTAVEVYASEAKAGNIEAGVNLSHDAAFDVMLRRNYRISFIGVAMQKPNEPAHNRKENFVLDDWR